LKVTKDQDGMSVALMDVGEMVDKSQAKGAANRAQVLAALRNCPEVRGSMGGVGVGAADLVAYTGQGLKTVLKHLEALLTEGLIVESGRTHPAGGKRGKPIRLFSINRFQADLTGFPSDNSREPGEDDT
jgi:DNA-binding transcriptional ArsR family regulator